MKITKRRIYPTIKDHCIPTVFRSDSLDFAHADRLYAVYAEIKPRGQQRHTVSNTDD